jgi:hypothetical protein
MGKGDKGQQNDGNSYGNYGHYGKGYQTQTWGKGKFYADASAKYHKDEVLNMASNKNENVFYKEVLHFWFDPKVRNAIWDQKATILPMPNTVATRLESIINELPLGCSDEDWQKYVKAVKEIKTSTDPTMQANFMSMDALFDKYTNPTTSNDTAINTALLAFLAKQQTMMENLATKVENMGNQGDDDDEDDDSAMGPRKSISKAKAKAPARRRRSL